MGTRILDRGRGPEIEGTRITVYCVMDSVQDGLSPQEIAGGLDLTGEQVQAALDYIASHRSQVEAEYAKVLARAAGTNPPWVDADAAHSWEDLRQRIQARKASRATHASPGRQ